MENMPSVLAEKIIGGFGDLSRAELTALARQVLEEDKQGKGIEMLADAARRAQEASTDQYINDPMNWETELYDNIRIRAGGISSDVSEEERTRFLEAIVLEEAKKLQDKYRTVYAASDNILATIFSPGLHKKLAPLFTEHSTEEAEINPLIKSFADGLSRGLFAGLWSEAFKGMPIKGAGELKIPEAPKPASLSDVDVRKWYLENESKIPSLLDKTKPLEQQAKQAVELRNQFRTQARAAMTNRTAAEALDITDPNQTWQMLVDKYSAKGLSGDDLYREIIKAAQRSRTSVNHMLGID